MSDRAALYDVIDDFDTCIMTTFTAGGTPHGRPMHIAHREGDTLWFITALDSAKVDEADPGDPVVLTFQSDRSWVAATGEARLTTDRERVATMWAEPMRAWFPDGPEDPGTAALGVTLESAEYWTMSAGDVVSFTVGVARSMLTGKPIDPEQEGEHGDVRL